MLRGAMATRKKTTKKTVKAKRPAKAPKKAARPVKRPAKKPARKPAKKAKGRTPPMHGRVVNPELSDAAPAGDETFEIFKSFDRDGSGSIDRAEFARLLEALGQAISEEELEIALDVVDSNGSGRISWPEFSAWWSAA